MSAYDNSGAVRAASKVSTTSEYQAPRYWELADRYAAKHRVELARRYQDEHDRLDAEFNNLCTSQSWLATQTSQDTARLLIDYTEVMASYLEERGLRRQLVRWCDDGVRACQMLDVNPSLLLLLRGQTLFRLGQWNEAVASILAAMQASEGEEPSTYAQAILTLGRLQLNRGDPRTLETLARAEQLLSQQLDYEKWAEAKHLVVSYYNKQREFKKALSLCREVEQVEQLAGTENPKDRTLMLQGVIHRRLGDYQQAIECLQRLLHISELQGNKENIALALHHLAWVYLNQGDDVQARRSCAQALALYEEIGDIRGLSDTLDQLGLIDLAVGNKEEALFHQERSLAIRRQFNHPPGEANTLRHLAMTSFNMGNILTAAHYLWQSLVIYWRLGTLSRQRLVGILRELLDWTVGQRRWTM